MERIFFSLITLIVGKNVEIYERLLVKPRDIMQFRLYYDIEDANRGPVVLFSLYIR